MDEDIVARQQRAERDQLPALRKELKHASRMLHYWQHFPDRAAAWADRADWLRLEILRRERQC